MGVTIELRDAITLAALAVSLLSVILVSRNSRKATSVQMQNTDLTRIRDLRHELAETKTELSQTRSELTVVKGQVADLSIQLDAANERSLQHARREIEMIQYARMPGVTMEDWLEHFDQVPPELGPRR
jgi:hypothetical protein